MFEKALATLNQLRIDHIYKRSSYSTQLADLPPGLYPTWKRSAAIEFKGIPRDAFFFARAAEGLMMFFDCVRLSDRPCGLPSKAADSVWHVWASMAPEHLESFCRRHFGRTIPHIESAAMAGSMDEALANCLVAARTLDKLPVAGANVPRLFTLDRRLAMPNGFSYTLERGYVALRSMTWQGAPKGALTYLAGLAPAGLLAAGLVSQSDHDAHTRKALASSTGCGSGGGCSSSDSSSGDGGSCGSSCGSGCGGGCGS